MDMMIQAECFIRPRSWELGSNINAALGNKGLEQIT
jgi:hypothetical protein